MIMPPNTNPHKQKKGGKVTQIHQPQKYDYLVLKLTQMIIIIKRK